MSKQFMHESNRMLKYNIMSVDIGAGIGLGLSASTMIWNMVSHIKGRMQTEVLENRLLRGVLDIRGGKSQET
jgi:hypothetical protein